MISEIKILKGFILGLTLISCSNPSDKGDKIDYHRLTGRYVYQANLMDTIDVSSGETYTNYTWWEGKPLKNAGTWQYDSTNGRIRFHHFSFLLDSMPNGTWIPKIKTEGSEIRLIYATDIYKGYFLRIDSIDRAK